MILKINSWFGRVGNNIIQLRNVILIAIYYNHNIEIPKHNFFNTTFIKISDNTNQDVYVDNEGCDFFYYEKIKKFDRKCFFENIDKMKNILKTIVSIDYSKVKSLDSTLVIHIRGGDLFSHSPPQNYIHPPLKYYKDIIEANDYKKIIILCEDNINPIIEKLLNTYPQISFKKNNLEQDILTIISCKYIVHSLGTFIPSLLLLNSEIEKVYYPNYSVQINESIHYFSNVNFISSNLDTYNKIMGKWENKASQNKFLIAFK
jgi:hypothetical protein